MTRSEQRLEELARRKKHHALHHKYLASPRGFGRGCLICGRMPEDHGDGDNDADDVSPGGGDTDGDAGAGAGGGAAGGGGAGP